MLLSHSHEFSLRRKKKQPHVVPESSSEYKSRSALVGVSNDLPSPVDSGNCVVLSVSTSRGCNRTVRSDVTQRQSSMFCLPYSHMYIYVYFFLRVTFFLSTSSASASCGATHGFNITKHCHCTAFTDGTQLWMFEKRRDSRIPEARVEAFRQRAPAGAVPALTCLRAR